MLKREVFLTGDGSSSIRIPEWNEQYHSKHGAIQEAKHVFIEKGLKYKSSTSNSIHILEVGMGSGLNVLLSILFAEKNKIHLNYRALEAFPLKEKEWKQMNFSKEIEGADDLYKKIHLSPWEREVKVSPYFKLFKEEVLFQSFKPNQKVDLIYFDAFGPRVQPELWEEEIMKIMYECLNREGVMVTYSAKGTVRRLLENIGFKVEKLEGPPGKREMLRAQK